MRGKSLVILFIFSFLFLSSNASAQETTVSGGAKVSDPSNTGSASAGIPIEVPPGRNGIAPNLALTYSSNGGNGWVGVGWDIGLGEIMRLCTLSINDTEIRKNWVTLSRFW